MPACAYEQTDSFSKAEGRRFESGFPLQFILLRGMVVSVPGPPLALFTARGSAPILTRVRARSRRAAAPTRPQLKLTLAAVVAAPAARRFAASPLPRSQRAVVACARSRSQATPRASR